MDLNYIKNTFKKSNRLNSGLNCLFSIINYYCCYVRNDQIRALYDSNIGDCSSLLKLHETAKILGLDTEGYEAELDDLKNLSNPVILLVNTEKEVQHFIICYGFDGRFLIGDPRWGIVQYTEEELSSIWKSKAMLTLTPNAYFIKRLTISKKKRELFWKLFKENEKCLTPVFVIGLLSSVIVVSAIVILQKFFEYNFYTETNFFHFELWSLFFAMLAIWIALQYLQNRLIERYTSKLSERMTNEIFPVIFNQKDEYYLLHSSAELMGKIDNNLSLIDDIQKVIKFIFCYLPIALATLIGIACYNLYAFFSAFVGLTVFTLFIWWYKREIDLNQTIICENQVIRSTLVLNVLNKIRVIKAFRREPLFEEICKEVTSKYQNSSCNIINLKNIIKIWYCLISMVVFSTVAVITVLANIKHGETIALLIMVLLFICSLGDSIPVLFSFVKVKKEFNIFFELFSSAKNGVNADTIIPIEKDFEIQDISIQKVNFRFPGRSRVLEDISFEIKKGYISAIYGANGSGKSTIIEILQQNMRPESGQIYINRRQFEEINPDVLRTSFAVVNHPPQLINGTVFDNISVGCTLTEIPKIINFCNEMGFDVYFSQLPQKYNTIISERASAVSSGNQKLIAMARALYRKPQLLLLDEPFTYLDRDTSEFIGGVLQKCKNEMAILIATTDISVVQRVDYVYMLDAGKIIFSGTPDQFTEQQLL